ncbi:hypothetical protein TcBrA4_0002750 [Trypanosoma cruzi]|nr:hypothetical protein TcBrA4_0002750 [Trypanosoma cruzi]
MQKLRAAENAIAVARKHEDAVKQKARAIINAAKTEYQRQPFVLPEPQETEQLQRANDSPRAPLDEPPLTKEKLEVGGGDRTPIGGGGGIRSRDGGVG